MSLSHSLLSPTPISLPFPSSHKPLHTLNFSSPNSTATATTTATTTTTTTTTTALLHQLGLTPKQTQLLFQQPINPFLDFLVRLDIPPSLLPSKLHRLLLLLSTHPHHFPAFQSKLHLLNNYSIPNHKLPHILNNVNIRKVFFEMPIHYLEETILFFHRFGWPEIILRRPVLLNLDLHTQLAPRVDFLIHLADGDEDAAALLIRKLPNILAYTLEHYESHLEFWMSDVGLTKQQVFKIALVYPNIFSVSKERKLEPRIGFLRECGFDVEEIFKFLIKAPLFLSLSFEDNLSKKLGFLVKIGYRYRSKEMALAAGATTRTSCENMQKVVGLFMEYGFSFEDVLVMSKKHPQILQYKYESLEKKMEFLIEEMERDVGELMAFPAFLGYKLDDRIKRRYEMKKEVRGKGMSLNKLLCMSTEKFNLKMGGSSDCDSNLKEEEEEEEEGLIEIHILPF